MLANPVFGSRTWICTIAAPALAASTADPAICSGVTGTAGFFPTLSADPVTAHEIITLRDTLSSHQALAISLHCSTSPRYCVCAHGTLAVLATHKVLSYAPTIASLVKAD